MLGEMIARDDLGRDLHWHSGREEVCTNTWGKVCTGIWEGSLQTTEAFWAQGL